MFYLDETGEPIDINETTFAGLNMKEANIEELLRKNIRLVCEEDESLLVVGQQVRNKENGRSDLTAIDGKGNLVLIEIKRDVKDIEARSEAFEFQAIRYAASFASIRSQARLIRDVFGPYVEKHKSEFPIGDAETIDVATKMLQTFLNENGVDDESFNARQRIILVASDYDAQTLSAVAWLVKNKVDITCFRICPYELEGKIIIDMKKILPAPKYRDFYVEVVGKGGAASQSKRNGRSSTTPRQSLPKIDVLIANKVVNAGDIIRAKDKDDRARLLANGHVVPINEADDGKELSLQQWLRDVFGWSSVQTYAFSVHEASGKTLSELRSEWMRSEEYKD